MCPSVYLLVFRETSRTSANELEYAQRKSRRTNRKVRQTYPRIEEHSVQQPLHSRCNNTQKTFFLPSPQKTETLLLCKACKTINLRTNNEQATSFLIWPSLQYLHVVPTKLYSRRKQTLISNIVGRYV